MGVKKALSLCFSLNADELLAAGHKHFKVWTLSGGGLMQGKRGIFGSGSKVREERNSWIQLGFGHAKCRPLT